MEDGFPDEERAEQSLPGLGSPHCFPHQNGERVERYSRKVFVGGLPPDIDEGILAHLSNSWKKQSIHEHLGMFFLFVVSFFFFFK